MTTAHGRPTPQCPLLIGLLIDVSGSMRTAIDNRSGQSVNRLEGFRDAFAGLVARAGQLSRGESGERVAPLLKLFAYGFGFGGILSWLGDSREIVRDLLQVPGSASSTVPLDELTANWPRYQSHVERLAYDMFGTTPMREGLEIALVRFEAETSDSAYFGPPILFLLSDGEPTGATSSEVVAITDRIKQAGILVVACYVTSDDLAEPRRLYRSPPSGWPAGASLMLECASVVPAGSPFLHYLQEYKWVVEPEGKLFTQINQSEVLSEFMNVLLSPLEKPRTGSTSATATVSSAPDSGERADAAGPRPVRVFVSYSHADAEYVSPSGLLGYLSGLARERIQFWHDERLTAGQAWDERIRAEINRSDVALVLVSQSFLNSDYCRNTEIKSFLARRAASGLVIFPIIVSHCDWESEPWLASTQFEPRNGGSIEHDYKDRGRREALYLRILNQLRSIAQSIRSQ